MAESLPFEPRKRDVRIERGRHVYWVRAVRKRESLTSGFFSDGTITGIVLAVLFEWLLRWWQRRDPRWKVGVIRYDATSVLKRFHTLHQEVLEPGTKRRPRIAELVGRVESGEFDPR